MAKVFGMHMIGLRPGVKGEDFEKFFREKVPSMQLPHGWKTYLLKGDRGDREGKYLVMVEIESVESRDSFSPQADQFSEEAQRGAAVDAAIWQEWEKYASSVGAPTIYTDYVVVG